MLPVSLLTICNNQQKNETGLRHFAPFLRLTDKEIIRTKKGDVCYDGWKTDCVESDRPDCNYGAVLHNRWGDDAVLIRLVFSGNGGV